MKSFTVYDEITGKILRTGSCPDIDFESQTDGVNEKVIEGRSDDVRQKVVNGEIVARPANEIPPPKIPTLEVRPTKAEWEALQNRITVLEATLEAK